MKDGLRVKRRIVGMLRPIKIALFAALPTEVLAGVLDGVAGDSIKGLPSSATLLDRFISCGWGIMHWQLGYILDYLVPSALKTGTEGPALLLATFSLLLVGYVNWVLIISMTIYGFHLLARKRTAVPA